MPSTLLLPRPPPVVLPSSYVALKSQVGRAGLVVARLLLAVALVAWCGVAVRCGCPSTSCSMHVIHSSPLRSTCHLSIHPFPPQEGAAPPLLVPYIRTGHGPRSARRPCAVDVVVGRGHVLDEGVAPQHESRGEEELWRGVRCGVGSCHVDARGPLVLLAFQQAQASPSSSWPGTGAPTWTRKRRVAKAHVAE